MSRRLPIFFAPLLLAGMARAQTCPPNNVWPEPDWVSRADSVVASKDEAITAFDDYTFTLVGNDEERLGVRTDGVVIVKGGQIIYEHYGRGFDADHRHIGWSVAKSIVETLVGVSVARGTLRLDRSICDYLRDYTGEVCQRTVKNILELASGFDWNEVYESGEYGVSSVLAMLYGEGQHDMARFTAMHDVVADPGTRFVYSTGEAILLAAIVGAAVEAPLRDSFPWVLLFDPLGMRSVTFERDPQGTFIGGSYVYAPPRDMARLGYFYLNDGCWNGERLLPEGWVAKTTTPNEAFLRAHPTWNGPEVPGRLWWLNVEVDGITDGLAWPDVPADAFAALGHWGQMIVVIPSLDLVIVRTGDDRESGVFDNNEFIRLAMAIAKGA